MGPPLGPQVLPGHIAVCPRLLGDQHQIFHSGGSLKNLLVWRVLIVKIFIETHNGILTLNSVMR